MAIDCLWLWERSLDKEIPKKDSDSFQQHYVRWEEEEEEEEGWGLLGFFLKKI